MQNLLYIPTLTYQCQFLGGDFQAVPGERGAGGARAHHPAGVRRLPDPDCREHPADIAVSKHPMYLMITHLYSRSFC